jgi:hypothetical protein
MAITALMDPAQMPNRSMDQQTFDNAFAALVANLPLRGQQENDLAANMTAAAAGGAYALSYTFDPTTADADPGVGKLRLSSATQNAATVLRLDTTSGGSDVSSILDTFDASTGQTKGAIRLTKMGDPSKFLLFNVTARTAPTGYRNISVVNTGGSSASPFVNGDTLMLFFQRAGDQGAAGSLTQVLWVNDEKASGTPGGDGAQGAYVVRVLNTVKKNSITGATVASNQITLPAGTYRLDVIAPSAVSSSHKVYFHNVTDGATVAGGSSQYGGSGGNTLSIIGRSEFTIATAKTFEVRHWIGTNITSTGLGSPASTGQAEVFTQVFIEKVS